MPGIRTSTPAIALAALVIALAGTPRAAAGQAPGSGSLHGCVTDTTGTGLPGVTVDVSQGSVHRIMTTRPDGCWEVVDVPPGTYVVFARLAGFASVAREPVPVAAGRRERIDFRMAPHGICECVGPASTLSSLWTGADAVVHVRIAGHRPARPATPQQPSYLEETATVLRAVKPHPKLPTSGPLRFLRPANPLYAEEEPYAIGQEFVIFLTWNAALKAFVRQDVRLGGAAAFALETDRIRSAGLAGYNGKPLDLLLWELRMIERQSKGVTR